MERSYQLLHCYQLLGGTGGICSRTATAPLERVKILAQVGTTRGSMFQTWAKIIEHQGIRGLWRGNLVNCRRVFPFGGLVTFSYGNITNLMPLSTTSKKSYLYRFGAGVAAGGIATTLTYPMDLIRYDTMHLLIRSSFNVYSTHSSNNYL